MALQKTIKELIEFYVKINYENHLKQNNITHINESQIHEVIDKFYDGEPRKQHIKTFVLSGINKLTMEKKLDPYDLTNVSLLLDEIMNDEGIVKSRVYTEITLFQKHKLKEN